MHNTHAVPDWLDNAAKTNPYAYSFMKLGQQMGFNEEFFQLMARTMLESHEKLIKANVAAALHAPSPLVVGARANGHDFRPTPGVGEISTPVPPRDRSRPSARSGQQNPSESEGSDGR